MRTYRIGAVQAFETDEKVVLLIQMDRLGVRRASGSPWDHECLVLVTVSGRSVSYERAVTTLSAHPNSVRAFGHGGEFYIWERSPDPAGVFHRWSEGGPVLVGRREHDRLHALLSEEGFEEVMRREGWSELPIDEAALSITTPHLPGEPDVLRPRKVPAAVELDYDRRAVRVKFFGPRGATGDEVEIKLTAGIGRANKGEPD